MVETDSESVSVADVSERARSVLFRDFYLELIGIVSTNDLELVGKIDAVSGLPKLLTSDLQEPGLVGEERTLTRYVDNFVSATQEQNNWINEQDDIAKALIMQEREHLIREGRDLLEVDELLRCRIESISSSGDVEIIFPGLIIITVPESDFIDLFSGDSQTGGQYHGHGEGTSFIVLPSNASHMDRTHEVHHHIWWMLEKKGILPECVYLDTDKKSVFDSFKDEALAMITSPSDLTIRNDDVSHLINLKDSSLESWAKGFQHKLGFVLNGTSLWGMEQKDLIYYIARSRSFEQMINDVWKAVNERPLAANKYGDLFSILVPEIITKFGSESGGEYALRRSIRPMVDNILSRGDWSTDDLDLIVAELTQSANTCSPDDRFDLRPKMHFFLTHIICLNKPETVLNRVFTEVDK